jgi:hypothetical protein
MQNREHGTLVGGVVNFAGPRGKERRQSPAYISKCIPVDRVACDLAALGHGMHWDSFDPRDHGHRFLSIAETSVPDALRESYRYVGPGWICADSGRWIVSDKDFVNPGFRLRIFWLNQAMLFQDAIDGSAPYGSAFGLQDCGNLLRPPAADCT